MAQIGRTLKEAMVGELTDAVSARGDFFVASMGAVRGVETDTLRKRMRALDGHVHMLKRRLSMRVSEALKVNGSRQEMFGGGVVFIIPGEDVLKTAKVVAEFAKGSEGRFSVRGGWVDGGFLSAARVIEFASLPPRNQLIAEIVGWVEAPMSGVVWGLESTLGEIARVLEEAAKSRPGAASQPEKSGS